MTFFSRSFAFNYQVITSVQEERCEYIFDVSIIKQSEVPKSVRCVLLTRLEKHQARPLLLNLPPPAQPAPNQRHGREHRRDDQAVGQNGFSFHSSKRDINF